MVRRTVRSFHASEGLFSHWMWPLMRRERAEERLSTTAHFAADSKKLSLFVHLWRTQVVCTSFSLARVTLEGRTQLNQGFFL